MDDSAETTAAEQDVVFASVLTELGNGLLNGREATFEVLKSVLADKDVKLDEVTFSRYCLDDPIETYLPALLAHVNKPRLSSEKLAHEITEGVKLSLTDGTRKVVGGARKLMDAVQERGLHVGLVSDLDGETAAQVAERLGLSEEQTAIVVAENSTRATTDVGSWVRIVRALGTSLNLCVAVVTSAAACRAAISAGLRCVAVPDRFTSFQDFGGADVVCDTFDADALEHILALLPEA